MTHEIQALLEQFRSQDVNVHMKAFSELLKVDATAVEIVEPLCQILADEAAPDMWLMSTLNLLGNMGDKAAVVPIVNLLKRPQSPDTMLARKYAAYALTDLKDARAVDVLIDLLQEKQWLEKEDDYNELYLSDEPDHEVIEAAIGALASIGEWRGIHAAIERLLVGDTWCDCGMGEWGGERAYQYLVEATKSTDTERLSCAISLLGEFNDSRAIEVILPFLDAAQPDDVRRSAVYALQQVLYRQTIPYLLPLMTAQNTALQFQVAIAIKYWVDVYTSSVRYKTGGEANLQQVLTDIGEERLVEVLLDCIQGQRQDIAAYGVLFLNVFEPFVTDIALKDRIRTALENQSDELKASVLKVRG